MSFFAAALAGMFDGIRIKSKQFESFEIIYSFDKNLKWIHFTSIGICIKWAANYQFSFRAVRVTTRIYERRIWLSIIELVSSLINGSCWKVWCDGINDSSAVSTYWNGKKTKIFHRSQMKHAWRTHFIVTNLTTTAFSWQFMLIKIFITIQFIL